MDACGVCRGDNATCAGCDGVAFSTLAADICGVCDGDGSSCYCTTATSRDGFLVLSALCLLLGLASWYESVQRQRARHSVTVLPYAQERAGGTNPLRLEGGLGGEQIASSSPTPQPQKMMFAGLAAG